MGIESQAPVEARATYLDVFESLYVVIAQHRNPVHADDMARALLRVDSTTRELVGLTDNASEAIYWSRPADAIVATRFDKHGVTEQSETLCQPVSDPSDWIAVHEIDLIWMHPRYRG